MDEPRADRRPQRRPPGRRATSAPRGRCGGRGPGGVIGCTPRLLARPVHGQPRPQGRRARARLTALGASETFAGGSPHPQW